MSNTPINKNHIAYHPVTKDNWLDFEKLFNNLGVQKGCWCMYWRSSRADFNKNYGEGNKQLMKKIIDSGKIPGIIASYENEPIAWCSIAPREDYQSLERSRTLKKIDDKPVWSIICFFIVKKYRHQGLSSELIKSAIKYAKSNGAKIIEAYPIMPEKSTNPKPESYTGFKSTFDKLGFKMIACNSKIRPIMRFYI